MREQERGPVAPAPGGTDPRMDEMAAREGEPRREGMRPTEPTDRPGVDDPSMGESTASGTARRDAIDGTGAGERTDRGTMGTMGQGTGVYRERFDAVLATFIDDPGAAVDSARSLVEEAVDRMMDQIGRDVGDRNDTERMRLALRRYRALLDRVTTEA